MNQNNPGDGGGADHTVTPFRDVNAETTQRRIADDLRHARVARGLEIADAARMLRIRAVYLVALEEGRFAELPGPTYVAGFLRAYGRFLDLDGDELVRRYKDESGGALVRQQLNFPVPASEARHPTGIMIAAALVIALIVAAAWFLLKDREWADLELVPEVPEEMAGQLEDEVDEPDIGATASGREIPSDAATEAVDQADATEPEASVDPEAAVEAEGAAQETEAAADEAALTTSEPTMGEEDVAASSEIEAVDATADIAANDAELAGEDDYVPRIYGLTNTDSRVEIRAISETWIQVEGPNNEMLLTRVLLPGDIFRVPNRDDVTLDTGNAGGLELRVDGIPVPPLGATGIVVRNVSLAPESLLAR